MANRSKILVIEDEEVTLRLLLEILKKAGYDAFGSLDAVKGMDLALSQKPDLLLLDVYMPVRNGWSVLSELRAKDEFRDLPVIVLTSDKQTQTMNFAYELGISSYLTKPIDADLLKNKIRQVLSPKEPGKESP